MTNELIQKFVELKSQKSIPVNIHFKQRSTLKGVFIRTNDYDELRMKNFWRIVPATRAAEWEKTKDGNLARIYNGAEFVRLTESN
ncbi:MAG: short-chain dehydrogenase [Ferruginibacter sp.]